MQVAAVLFVHLLLVFMFGSNLLSLVWAVRHIWSTLQSLIVHALAKQPPSAAYIICDWCEVPCQGVYEGMKAYLHVVFLFLCVLWES